MASGSAGLYVNPNTGAAQAGLAQFRNAIINGDMRINQRGTSTNLGSMTAVATAAPGSWVVDRWNVLRSGYAAGGVMAQGTDLTSADLPFIEAGIKNYARIGRVSGNALTNGIALHYNMESQDCYRFVGQQITVSFYYRTGANFSGSSIGVNVRTGTGTDQAMRSGFTGAANTTIATCSTSSVWRRVTSTTVIPSSVNQIGLDINYSPVGTAQAADYFDITGVQLELGSVATPFEVRPFPVELQLCQRYYQTFLGGIALYCGDGNTYEVSVQFLVPMRTTPSMTSSTIANQGGTFSVGWPKIFAYNSNSYAIQLGMTSAQKGSVRYNIVADSEL